VLLFIEGRSVLDPDEAKVRQVLTDASESGQTMLWLVSDDGVRLDVCLGGGDTPQLLLYETDGAEASFCATSPLTLDNVHTLFVRFAAQDERWRDVVQWTHPAPAAQRETSSGGLFATVKGWLSR
jgi:hypothetical protein